MGALIHIENMKKIYNPGENEVRALDGIDLDIEKGDLVAIVERIPSISNPFGLLFSCGISSSAF